MLDKRRSCRMTSPAHCARDAKYRDDAAARAQIRGLSRLRAAPDRCCGPGSLAPAHRPQPPGHRLDDRAHEFARRVLKEIDALMARAMRCSQMPRNTRRPLFCVYARRAGAADDLCALSACTGFDAGATDGTALRRVRPHQPQSARLGGTGHRAFRSTAALSSLLGFEGLLENAYDANHLAPSTARSSRRRAIDCRVQIGSSRRTSRAVRGAVPWFVLAAGEITGVSSIHAAERIPPPRALRAQASLMLGDMHGVLLLAHNTRIGMFDYRLYDPVPCTRPLLVMICSGRSSTVSPSTLSAHSPKSVRITRPRPKSPTHCCSARTCRSGSATILRRN